MKDQPKNSVRVKRGKGYAPSVVSHLRPLNIPDSETIRMGEYDGFVEFSRWDGKRVMHVGHGDTTRPGRVLSNITKSELVALRDAVDRVIKKMPDG